MCDMWACVYMCDKWACVYIGDMWACVYMYDTWASVMTQVWSRARRWVGVEMMRWKRWHVRAVDDTRLAALEEEGRQGPAQGAQSFQILQLHLARR